MAQWSGPIAKGTLAERQFSDVLWRHLNGAEPGIVNDLDGTAYNITLPPDSDVAQIGSTTQDSTSVVAGFANIIDAGTSVGITIPAATTERTDLIVARYIPDTIGLPGPVQIMRVAGTSSGLPVHDDGPPGAEEMPLWAVTRKPGEALSQAKVIDLRRRIVLHRTVPVGAPLPPSSPLDSIVQQGGATYRRELGSSRVPQWVDINQPPGTTACTLTANWSSPPGHRQEAYVDRSGVVRVTGWMQNNLAFTIGGAETPLILPPDIPRPARDHMVLLPNNRYASPATATIRTDGVLQLMRGPGAFSVASYFDLSLIAYHPTSTA